MAHSYLIFFFPELLTHSFLHPIRIYLRVQGVTHLIIGVVAASNFSILFFLLLHVSPRCAAPTRDCLFGWKPLLRLDLPRVEVVRDHDRLVWPPHSPHRHRCFHGDSYSDHFSHLHLLLFTQFRGFDSHGNELGANCPSHARLSAVVSVFLAEIMGFSAMFFTGWRRIFTGDEGWFCLSLEPLPLSLSLLPLCMF
ncbi:hypothetical protein Fmac_014885 [Flemingia macrophylla]|uniref:Uncharacterized protein n=1 Tax=Flemingia macrophylla TaxID=520843 RepID=A0ABD1MD07_9FABA